MPLPEHVHISLWHCSCTFDHMEPLFLGVTTCILLEYPATINESSVTSGLEITFSGDSNRRFALSNIESRIGIGIDALPLSAADKGRGFVALETSWLFPHCERQCQFR